MASEIRTVVVGGLDASEGGAIFTFDDAISVDIMQSSNHDRFQCEMNEVTIIQLELAWCL